MLEQGSHLTLGGGRARQEACTLSWPGAGGPNWLLSLGQGTRLLVTAISQPPYDQDYHQAPVIASWLMASMLMAYSQPTYNKDYHQTWVTASLHQTSLLSAISIHVFDQLISNQWF